MERERGEQEKIDVRKREREEKKRRREEKETGRQGRTGTDL